MQQRLAPPPVSADIGIVMAMPIEAGYLFDSLNRVRKYTTRSLTITEGEIAGKIVAVVLSGIGRSAARRAADVMIAGHHPRWLVSAGFAGALDPELSRNDLVMPHQIVDLDGNLVDVGGPQPPVPGIGRIRGRLLTVDSIIPGSVEKAELRNAHQADLLDMETAAVAILARDRAIRFLPIRIISDDAREELPREISSLLSHSGSYRVGVALRSIWNRPSTLKDFWNLHSRALEASDRLATCLRRLIEELPPS